MSLDLPPHARRLRQPLPDGLASLPQPLHVVVVGGGIAGIAAATVLVERGARVTLIEASDHLGGRAGAWTDQLADGTSFEMERGFHAFFRQYYNLRRLLQRIDPALSMLEPLRDYPILGPHGLSQSFSGLPRRTPLNIAALTWRTPALGLRELRQVNVGRAIGMLSYDEQKVYARFDEVSAGAWLDALNFPEAARRLLFDVFAHSFFNPEEDMSAAELLMMFHFYFTGNPEGLVFDVCRQPFSHAIFEPFARWLSGRGVDLQLSTAARSLKQADQTWTLTCDAGEIDADAVVLALNVPGLQALLAASAPLGDAAWRARVATLECTLPFVVWRMWLDTPVAPGRAPFVGTTGLGCLDNISLYHLFEDESRRWVEVHGGAVVELHAYAVPDARIASEVELKAELLAGLHALYPETRTARILEDRYLVRRDCPGFSRGSNAGRPGVTTPNPALTLAGDFVKLPFPSALMERAAASGMLAANHILGAHGVAPEPILTIAPRGLLAGVSA